GAGALAFAADTDQTKDITITLTDDKIDEATETIVITLAGFTGGAREGSQSIHTINLADSDDPPALGFDISGEATENNVSKAENSTYTPSIVMATGYSSDFPISIIWSIDEGVTTAVIDGQTNEDFEIRSTDGVALATYSGLNDAARTVTFPAGASSVNLLTISMPKDDLYEDSEILKLQIATPTSMSALDGSGNAASANGSFITSEDGNVQSTKTITITNSADETVPKASITATGGANEAATTADFTATLSANSGGASKAGKDLYVNYAIGTDGDNPLATLTSDYTLPDADGSRTITIPAYASSAAKTITLLDDAVYEYDEKIVINLAAYTTDATAAAAVDGDNDTYTYTITETDAAPILEFEDADRVAEYAESASNRSFKIQFQSGGTQEAEMDVYGYVSVSTDGSKTTAANGIDICEGAACSGATPHFENYEQVKIDAGDTYASKSFGFYADDRYEDAELVTFVLETFTAAEVSGINYNSYPGAASGQGAPDASNATTDGDEEFAVTISASGADERPVAEWVVYTGDLPYSASSGERTINENAGTGYFTLQLSKFSEKAVTVSYALQTTATTSNPPTLIATGHASTNTYPIDYTY
ncbi:uncharacterized protein METZ01_LOCUS191595, partial [marine metagenome]